MTIKSILFDLDGTLVDSVSWHEESLNCALEDIAGFRLEQEENKIIFTGKLTKDKLLILSSQGRLPLELHHNVIDKKKYYFSRIIKEKSCIDPFKQELFDNLRNFNLACVSNSNRNAVDALLSAVRLRNYFSLIISGNDVICPKPSSEGYNRAMSHFKCKPIETIIVEDSPLGLNAAYNTGAHVWEVSDCKQVNLRNFNNFIKSIECA